MSIPRDEDAPTEEQDRTISDVLATIAGVVAGSVIFYVLYLYYVVGRGG